MRNFILLSLCVLISSGHLYANDINVTSIQYFATVTGYNLAWTMPICTDTEQGGMPVGAQCRPGSIDPASGADGSFGLSGGFLSSSAQVTNPGLATGITTMDFYADGMVTLILMTSFRNSGGVEVIVKLTDLTDKTVLLNDIDNPGSFTFSLNPSTDYELESYASVFNVEDVGSARVDFSGTAFVTPESSSLALLLPCLAVLGIARRKLRT